MLFIFIVVFLSFLLFNYVVFRSFLLGFTFVFVPYVGITIVNNLLLYNYFYEISSDALLVLTGGMIIYEISALVLYAFYQRKISIRIVNKPIDYNFSLINFKPIYIYVIIVCGVRLLLVIKNYLTGGLSLIAANDYNTLNAGIIGGRLLILLYPFGWLILLRMLNDFSISKTEKKNSFVMCILIAIVWFTSPTKTDAMIFLLGCYLIAIKKDRKWLGRGFLILVGLVVLMFFANTAIRWFVIDSSTPDFEYTVSHFWKYIASGTINLSGTISKETTYSFFDYWTQVLSPIPNEFLSKIGIEITPTGRMPYIEGFPYVSSYYPERSNVVCLFGRMYGNGNVFGYIINVAIFALITEIAFIKYKTSKSLFSFLPGMALLAYSFLSFFSMYYAVSSFWQVLIYTFIAGYLFERLSIFRRKI